MLALAALLKDFHHLRRLRSTDDKAVRLDDTSFFRANRRKSIAKDMGMFQPDGREHGNLRRQHVRGVKTPAQADFDHCNVYMLAGKVEKTQRRSQLEEGAKTRLWCLSSRSICCRSSVTSAAKSVRLMGWRSICVRSRMVTRCGLVNRPVRQPGL